MLQNVTLLTQQTAKGIPENELFGQAPHTDSIVKKGVEAEDRTFLNKKAHREVLSKLLENRDDPKALGTALRKMKAKGKNALPKHAHMDLVNDLIAYIETIATRVPIGFRELLYEIHLETPISALVSSNNDEAHDLLRNYLENEDDIFSDISKSQFIFQEFPVLGKLSKIFGRYHLEKF